MDSKTVKHKVKHTEERYIVMARQVVFALFMGTVLGAVGGAFYIAIQRVTEFREQNTWMIFFLPVTAIVILFFYHMLHGDRDRGTNLVLQSIQSDEDVPLRMSGLIFVLREKFNARPYFRYLRNLHGRNCRNCQTVRLQGYRF